MIVLTMKNGAVTAEVRGDGTLKLQHLESAIAAFRNTHTRNGDDDQVYRLQITTPGELERERAEEVEA